MCEVRKDSLEAVLVRNLFRAGLNAGAFGELVRYFYEAALESLEDPEAVAMAFREKRGDYTSDKLNDLLDRLDKLVEERKRAWGTPCLCDRLKVEAYARRMNLLAQSLLVDKENPVKDLFYDLAEAAPERKGTYIKRAEERLINLQKGGEDRLSGLCEHDLHQLAIVLLAEMQLIE